MCDEVGRGDISHKCCNVDTVKGSVRHIMFGHGRGCTNFKISNYCIMVRQAIYNCGCLDVFARGVIMMSSQWPCMCVGKFTCCVVSNDARMSLNVVVVADGVSK